MVIVVLVRRRPRDGRTVAPETNPSGQRIVGGARGHPITTGCSRSDDRPARARWLESTATLLSGTVRMRGAGRGAVGPARAALCALLCAVSLGAAPAAANVVVVLNSGEASVSLIDPATRKETRRFEVGKEPHHLMRTPDRQTLIVANAVSNDLHFLDPATGAIQRRVRDIPDPYQLGYSPDRKWFVTAALRLDRVDVYAVEGEGPSKNFRPVRQIKVPDAPSHLIFSADSTMVFATLQDSHEVVAIRLADQSIAWKIKVGNLPAGIWM
ncbi:MAG: hypothetical protein MUC68_17895, partial [Burkholderiaceae bacterium]|nr:hypothetical protein [Burkholderiaceae bacterium]